MIWDQTITGNNFLVYLLNIFWYQDNERIIEGHETFELVFYLITLMIQIGGAFWLVLGVISLASNLHEKSGSGIQVSVWRIAGGFAVILVMQLFGSVLNRSFLETLYLIQEVLLLSAKYVALAGGFWTIIGVISLASSIRNNNAPDLDSSIWQIVGGFLIILSSILLNFILKGINSL